MLVVQNIAKYHKTPGLIINLGVLKIISALIRRSASYLN
jgi:hypothetical protein